MKKTRPILALTMGDPAGIGPEICLKAIAEASVSRMCVPVLFGDVRVLQKLGGKGGAGILLRNVISAKEFEKNPRIAERLHYSGPSDSELAERLYHSPSESLSSNAGERLHYSTSKSPRSTAPERLHHSTAESLRSDAGERLHYSTAQSLRSNATERSNLRAAGSSDCGDAGRQYSRSANRSRIAEPLIVDCGAVNAGDVKPGRISAKCGRAAYIYIERAISAALAGKVDGVVTAPIHKEALYRSGIKYPGHTEIFTALTKTKRSCMMLYSDKLTVSMVTTHIGFTEVPKKISYRRILDVIELTAAAMQRIRGRSPKLAICGLNPHAGENGLFGNREEERYIMPAVRQAQKLGISIVGPLPPDAAFTTNQRKKFDAIVTLYHDQGHIPFKMLAFDTGVNVTLGLPIVRTSVDHGTAFDIAWQGKADASSLYSAIKVAADLAKSKI